ncbi:MAG: site-2 protease family protein [Candidatus Omnitrophota bacterium]
MQELIIGVMWYFVFLFSLVFHEAAHAFAALKLGDETAYDGGQVTLDPVPHIRREPLGMVVVPLISYLIGGWMFGWASAPYNIQWAMNYPKRSALMSLAGPVANLVLVIAAMILIRVGIVLGYFSVPWQFDFTQVVLADQAGFPASFAILLSIMFSLNVLLFVFNLIPVPPLDGSGVVPLFMKEETAQAYMGFIHQPIFMILGIFLAWELIGHLFYPVFYFFLNILYLGIS